MCLPLQPHCILLGSAFGRTIDVQRTCFWRKLSQNLNSILFFFFIRKSAFLSYGYPLSGPLIKGKADADCQERKAQCMFSYRTNLTFASRAAWRKWRREIADVSRIRVSISKIMLPLCVLSLVNVMTKHTYRRA